MVSSRPEVEWDETEQQWMLALEAWENEELCPMCGWPKEICQAPSAEFDLRVPPPTRCHVTTAIRRAQEERQAASSGKYDDALIWGAERKDQSSFSKSPQSSPVLGARSAGPMPDIVQ